MNPIGKSNLDTEESYRRSPLDLDRNKETNQLTEENEKAYQCAISQLGIKKYLELYPDSCEELKQSFKKFDEEFRREFPTVSKVVDAAQYIDRKLLKKTFKETEEALQEAITQEQKGVDYVPKAIDEESERAYRCAIDLLELKEDFEKLSTPKNEGLKPLLEESEKAYEILRKEFPQVDALIKTAVDLDKKLLKATLKETVDAVQDAVIKEQGVSSEELERDCKLFSRTPEEMKGIYLGKILKAVQKTGFHPSTVCRIEKLWKQSKTQPVEQKEELLIGSLSERHDIIVIKSRETGDTDPTDPEIFVKERKRLGEGGFKEVFLMERCIPKFEEKPPAYVLLKPLPKKEEKKTEEMTNKRVESKSTERKSEIVIEEDSETSLEERDGSTMVYEDAEDKQQAMIAGAKAAGKLNMVELEPRGSNLSEEEAYEKEIEFCLALIGEEGVCPTHKVMTYQGQRAIIQPAAGYRVEYIEEGQSVEKTMITLEKMSQLYKQGKLSKEDQKVYLKMIGDALIGIRSVHRKGILHRDIKPENIVCFHQGNGKITDFGVSCKLVGDKEIEAFGGTPTYISPESYALTDENWNISENALKQSGISIGPKSDVWSIGIMLWELTSKHKHLEHPAVGGSRMPGEILVALLKQQLGTHNDPLLRGYPEPLVAKKEAPQNNLNHLVWECTRLNPNDRIDLDELIVKYEACVKDINYVLDNPKLYPELASGLECFDFEGDFKRPQL